MHRRNAVQLFAITLLVFSAVPLEASALTLNSNLQLWDRSSDVLSLQQTLNGSGYPVALSGPGSRGKETDIFGPLTYRALISFQKAHGVPATGFLGPLTRSVIASTTSILTGSTIGTSAPAAPPATHGPHPENCAAPAGFSCLPGTSIVQPASPGTGYTPGFGGGGGNSIAPVITGVPANFSLAATSLAGASVTYSTPTATDDVDKTDPVTCAPGSGSVFAIGVTTVSCTATDKAGNAAHTSFTVTVSANAPSVSLTVPSNSATISGISVSVSAVASDVVGVASVQFKVDGSSIGPPITSSPYTTNWNSTVVSDGAHTLYAVALNNAGEYATSSVSLTVDNTPPSVSLTAPSSPSTVSGASVSLSAAASDNIAIKQVQFEVDGTNIGPAITSSPYATTWDSTSIGDGAHSISAVVQDTAGNVATSSISVIVDNTAPTFALFSSGTPTDATATITWTTNENATSKVVYGTTSSYGLASSSTAFVTSHSITISSLTASTTYHYAVVSADTQGNTATSSDQTFTTANYLALLQNDSDLLALWRMNESSGSTLADSKSGLNATISGGITLGTSSNYVTSDPSTAAAFDGSTGFASIGDASALNNFTRTAPFTITAIVKPNVGASTNYWIYTKAKDSSPTPGLEFGIRKSNLTNGGPTGVFVQFGASDPTQFIRLLTDQQLVNGQSYLVGVTYDGSGSAAGMQLYIDGNPVTSYDDTGTRSQSISAGQTTTAAGFPAQLGKWGAINQFFNGSLKDVAIFTSAKSSAWMRSLAVAARASNVNNPVATSSIYTPYTNPRPQVMLDADIDSDIDDVADEVLMLNLEHRAELDIVGTIITSANSKAAPTWLAIANYYGRSSIPIGVNTSAPGNSASSYDATTTTNFGVAGKTDASQFPSATSTQRQILAAAADHSIDYITTGDLSSVVALLQTPADQFSSLTGVQLVAQKVHSLWIAAGNWPSGPAISDFGSTATLASTSAYVLAHWPTSVPIIFDSISDGNAVRTGANVMEALSPLNPARTAWQASFGNSNTSNSQSGWSQIAMLALARGLGTYMTIGGGNGTASVNTTTGTTTWTQTVNSNQNYLVKVMSNSGLSSAINSLLLDPSAW